MPGISTESGIPDFRGPNGVWTKNPARREDGDPRSTTSATPTCADRRGCNRLDSPIWRADPNAGHEAIARLEGAAALDLLVTQNIDGLHHAAGSSPELVVEIHGNVREAKCMSCGWRGPMEETLDRVRAGEADPPCLECGGILKSATISFGENLVVEDLERAQAAAAAATSSSPSARRSASTPPPGSPRSRSRAGARLVVMNAEETPVRRRRRRRRPRPPRHRAPRLVARI